ncbi:hypothetical protein BBP40_009559 [Aspergillus hancockii]|nr:hypothetical protein BBP40_009559 [Aspergillus hancockii]
MVNLHIAYEAPALQKQNTIYSGGRLCGLSSVPAPQFPVFSSSSWPNSHKVVACGEYKGKGSLELYNLTPSGAQGKNGPLDMSSNLTPVYQNRQSSASLKVLSVESHGTRIVYSDGDGNIKWVERDGRTEARRFNINTYKSCNGWGQQQFGTSLHGRNHAENDNEARGLWNNSSSSRSGDEVARKILPIGGNLTGDEILIWTGERVGRIRFADVHGPREDEDEEDYTDISKDVDSDTREAIRNKKREERRQEREYSGMMRRALERQADEVRRMGGLGM